MSTQVLIGGQWGDEGKGKIVDVLTEDFGWIVRYQGGNNAGHTVEIGEQKFILHLIPSGILRPGKKCVLGNGVVIDAAALLKEIEGLKAKSISCDGRLFISDRAHLVLPYHKAQDAGREAGKGGETKIGTTRRGIGPTYGDKANRTGLRCSDLVLPGLAEKVRAKVEEKNLVLKALGVDTLDVAQVVDEMVRTAAALKGHVADTAVLLNEAIRGGEKVFFEGAQGTMLDIDHGTYPFVTSSNATSGGATTGTGVPPNRIKEVIGICKAYTTRVGEGPFPTELTEELGEKMGRIGAEFGATTGRKRRCGWFDAVVARHAVMINGVDWWTITKMDVLDTFETLRICTHYELDGRRVEHIPADIGEFARCRPVYEDHPGWMAPTKGITTYDQLPKAAKDYLTRIEQVTGAPVRIVSVGPKRVETIFR
jgi:adenylosuccinate synthase